MSGKNTFLFKAVGLFMNCDKMLGPEFEKGLENLKNVSEARRRRSPESTMNTPTSEYMILFRSTDWDKGLSPEEMQNIMARTMAWFDRLAEEGKFKAAQPLHDEGKLLPENRPGLLLTGLLRSRRRPSAATCFCAWTRSRRLLKLPKAGRCWMSARPSRCAPWLSRARASKSMA